MERNSVLCDLGGHVWRPAGGRGLEVCARCGDDRGGDSAAYWIRFARERIAEARAKAGAA